MSECKACRGTGRLDTAYIDGGRGFVSCGFCAVRRCPTCGSPDKEKRWKRNLSRNGGRWCSDNWHGQATLAITAARDYLVVIVDRPQAGAEVTSDGVPWRGTLAEARALAVRMSEQARRFGHTDTRYIPWSTSPQEPCRCGHLPTEHDEAGCYHECDCPGRQP